MFGPKPRDYSKKINGKVKALAFSRALFDRATAGDVSVIESFVAKDAKTKAIGAVVDRIAPKGKVLIVDAPFSTEAFRASAMVNILGEGKGDVLFGVDEALKQPGLAFHLYGKTQAAAKRKMGHFTVLADDADGALAKAKSARALLRWG